MGSYRQWAAMIRHVHKAHAEGFAEDAEFTEEAEGEEPGAREFQDEVCLPEPRAAHL